MTWRSPGGAPERSAWIWAGATVTACTLLVTQVQLYRVIENTGNAAYPQYVTRNFTAASVLLAVFLVPLIIKRLHLTLPNWAWILVGATSAGATFLPMILHGLGAAEPAQLLYAGQRVPQAGAVFADLSTVLKSVWCSGLGFDVYQEGNGCIDPVIYGPGVLWFDWLPVDLRSIVTLSTLGVAIAALACAAVALIARASRSLGVIAALLCVLGAPWLLMLERGNLDAIVIILGILAAFAATRWNRLWSWSLAAAMIWILGTWKYYPFAMGIALLPVVRIRHGWTVLVGYSVATTAFLASTWGVFRSSAQGYEGLLSIDDYVVLGRTPVVARMVDAVYPPSGLQLGDVFIFVLAAGAFFWGTSFAWRIDFRSHRAPMLASMGGALFLASILLAGFGWAYKATFLIMCIPLASLVPAYRSRARTYASVVVLSLTVVACLVVWNTVLATLAGVVAGSFSLGASLVLLIRRSSASESVPGTVPVGSADSPVGT